LNLLGCSLTDGPSRGNSDLAAAGGVARDACGRWLEGFVANMGCCFSLKAELLGAICSLQVAWEADERKAEFRMLLAVQRIFTCESISSGKRDRRCRQGNYHAVFFLGHESWFSYWLTCSL